MCSRLFSSSVPRHVHDTRVWQMATCQNLFWHALLRAKNAFGTSVYWWHAHGELKFQVYGTPLSRTACQRDTRKTIGTSTCVCRIIFSLTHTCVCVRVTAFPFFAWLVTFVTEQASQGNTRDINLKRDVPQTIKVRATEKKYWHMCVLKIYCSKKCGVPLWHARCAIGVSRWDERPDVRAAPSSLARPLLCHFSFCHVSLRACGIFSVRHARAWHTR